MLLELTINDFVCSSDECVWRFSASNAQVHGMRGLPVCDSELIVLRWTEGMQLAAHQLLINHSVLIWHHVVVVDYRH